MSVNFDEMQRIAPDQVLGSETGLTAATVGALCALQRIFLTIAAAWGFAHTFTHLVVSVLTVSIRQPRWHEECENETERQTRAVA